MMKTYPHIPFANQMLLRIFASFKKEIKDIVISEVKQAMVNAKSPEAKIAAILPLVRAILPKPQQTIATGDGATVLSEMFFFSTRRRESKRKQAQALFEEFKTWMSHIESLKPGLIGEWLQANNTRRGATLIREWHTAHTQKQLATFKSGFEVSRLWSSASSSASAAQSSKQEEEEDETTEQTPDEARPLVKSKKNYGDQVDKLTGAFDNTL
jgi:hypothetical protein